MRWLHVGEERPQRDGWLRATLTRTWDRITAALATASRGGHAGSLEEGPALIMRKSSRGSLRRSGSETCGTRPDGKPCRDVGGTAPWLSSGSSECQAGWVVKLADVKAIDSVYWLFVTGDDVKRVHRVALGVSYELIVMLLLARILLAIAETRRVVTALEWTEDVAHIDLVGDLLLVALWIGLVVLQWLLHGSAIACWLVERSVSRSAKLHCATPPSSLPAWGSLTICKLALPFAGRPNSSLVNVLGPTYYVLIVWHSILAVLSLFVIVNSVTPSLPWSTANHKLGRADSREHAPSTPTSVVRFHMGRAKSGRTSERASARREGLEVNDRRPIRGSLASSRHRKGSHEITSVESSIVMQYEASCATAHV